MRWLWVTLLAFGCDGPNRDTGEVTPTNASSAAGTTATASPTAASGAGAVPRSPFAGSWQGSFVAEKGEVDVPKGVPYKWWEKDEGADASGKGEVVLTIDDEGVVDGTIRGALGDLKVHGKLEDAPEGPSGSSTKKVLSAGLTGDVADGHGMNGMLVGTLADGKIDATLRVSSHDAALVRSAKLQLSQAK